jgi:hypothetical protein
LAHKTFDITLLKKHYPDIMTFPNSILLIIQTLLILSASLTCEVQGFSARRDYHSYHHISKRRNKKISSKKSSIYASKNEDTEVAKILAKAAKIRRNLAELDGKVFCSYNGNRKSDC